MRLSTPFNKLPTATRCGGDVVVVSNDFKHEPLPDAQTHIRLLKVIKARAGKLARCEISTWAIDSAPPYCAISYTWGDPADTVDIEINKKRKTVRRNCEYVLQQGYASDWNGHYWIDATCIDQNNIEEKNCQVAMMGGIYKKASRVFACVGPAADDSDFLFDTLKTYKKFFQNEYKRHFIGENKLVADHALAADYETVRHGYVPDNRHSIRGWPALLLRRTRLVNSYLRFLERPYFLRVWV